MAIVLKSPASGGCCDCAQQVNPCECDEGCTTACRSKSGEATLCGFDEFVASTPPKKYRHRIIGPEETTDPPTPSMTVCQAQTAEFEDCEDPACPGGWSYGWTGNPSASGEVVVASWSISLISTGGGNATYLANASAVRTSADPDEVLPARVHISRSGISHAYSDGQSFSVPLGQVWDVGGYFTYVFEQSPAGAQSCFTAGAPPLDILTDYWALDQEYHPDTCELSGTDDSERHEGVAYGCNPITELTPGAIPCENPEGCYGNANTVETATTRTTTGNGCRDEFDFSWTSTEGVIVESLSDEDTEADAIARAIADIEDWTSSSCLLTPAFIVERAAGQFSFAYRQVQVQVSWDAVISESYEITVNFYRRVLGTSGPFEFFSVEQRLVVADAVEETSDWIDVPNEAGWETRAQGCSVELQP